MATLEELLAQARSDADSYYKGQAAQANTAYNAEIASLQKALNNALAQEEISKTEANRLFDEGVASINSQSYNNSQVTDLTAHQNGINFSQQYLAQMQGDQFRTNQLQQSNTNQRNVRLTDIANRINTLRQNNDLSVAQATTSYNNNLVNLRTESDRMYNDRASSLNEMLYKQQLEYDLMLKQAALAAQSAGGSGGGGGGSSYSSRSGGGGSSSGGTAAANTTLSKAVNSYKGAKGQSQLDMYYANQQAQRNKTTSVLRQNNALANLKPIKAPARNPSLTSAQVANMLRKDAGVSTSKWRGTAKKSK